MSRLNVGNMVKLHDKSSRKASRARGLSVTKDRCRRWGTGVLGSIAEANSRQCRATLGAQTANVMNKMPKSVQPKAKRDLHEIWQAATRDDAKQAFDNLLMKYDANYHPVCECLRKDRDQQLAFYDFPVEYWGYLLTTNPIESTFATIRLRHQKTCTYHTRIRNSELTRTTLEMQLRKQMNN